MRALTPVGLFALALVVRLLPWPTVLESGRVVFFGMDAWYHIRRVQLALATGGWPPAFDAYVNFPHGAQPIWSPFFDALVAWAVWPVQATFGAPAVEVAAAFVPPLLGAFCVVVTYRVALRLFDPAVALASGLLLSILSAHYWYSQIGFLDHHVAVALAATGLLLLALRIFEAPAMSSRWAAGGALAGGCLLLWPGMLLHVVVAEAALWIFALSRSERAEAARAARGLALWNALAFAVVLPSGVSASWTGWSDFSPAVVSHFQPWMFGVLCAHAGASAFAFASTGAATNGRILQAVGLGVALVGVSAVAFPELLAGVDEARRWLTKDEVFQGLVKESKPLFIAETGFDRENAELRLSRFVYLLPIVLAVLVARARTSARRAELFFLVFWVAVLAVVTLLQRRFFNSLSPAYAIVLAWGAVTVWRERHASYRRDAARRITIAVVAALLLTVGLAPMLATYQRPLLNLADQLAGAQLTVPKNEHSRRVLLQTSDWIRANTPPTSGWLDPEVQPEYGVLAFWSFGHVLKYGAQRPTVVGNFGDDVGEANLRRVTAYFASREPDAARILEDLRARYVLVRTLGDVPPARLLGDAMRKRLSVDDSPGLERHRLVYESPLGGQYVDFGRSEYRVFERVAGATIAGNAPPGATVHAVLVYESNRRRRGRYQNSAVADEGGRYELRVPYASRGAPPAVRSTAAYRIVSGESVADLVVEEADVQEGRAVAGPNF
jgi:dolichyl-diphosphooligosaccharide--protein glycosyltransferase